jgi:hypothetical protein
MASYPSAAREINIPGQLLCSSDTRDIEDGDDGRQQQGHKSSNFGHLLSISVCGLGLCVVVSGLVEVSRILLTTYLEITVHRNSLLFRPI